jgi:methyl-accepting chemotaxis protein
MSAVLPATPPPATPAPRAGFFAHHGIWAPGVRLFRALGFSAKAVTISLAFMLPMLGLLGWLLKTHSDEALAARLLATQQQVALAHGLVAFAYAQQGSGQLGTQQAQQLARRLLATPQGGAQAAFWVITSEAAASDATAPDRAAVEQALRQGPQGFVRRSPPGGGEEVLSYAQRFEPWGWTVGATVPTADLGPALQRQLAWVGGALLLAQGVAGYLFLSFYRVMDGGLRETRRHLRAMAAGDLTTAPRGWGQDETAQVMQELARMQEALRSMVQRVRVSSDQIVDASAQIAAGSSDLSARSESAAEALKQSAASMAQIAATVQGGAELTEEASRTARHNAGIAEGGGRVMQEVVMTMEGIRGASSRIAEIVGTIDGIAFQTHILALNAAVEAAHAGAQGRGFAVVANEVRLLARRSADAAKEIKALIGGSVEQVQAGTLVVRKAGSAMHDIVAASQRVSEMLGEVATGARAQSQGLGRIGQQVVQLDRVTQENSALVGRTAGAAADLRALAHTLADEVARFRLPAG